MGSALSLAAKTSSVSLFLALPLLLAVNKPMVVTGQSFGVPGTVTVDISRNPTNGVIAFQQSGSFAVPAGASAQIIDETISSFRVIKSASSRTIGFLSPGNKIQYNIGPSFFNAEFSCIIDSPTVIQGQPLSTSVPLLKVNTFVQSGTGTLLARLQVLRDNGSGGPADVEGSSATSSSALLEAIGLNECTTCFFEYDTNNDPNDGFEAAIVWNVGSNDGSVCPTQAPTTFPSANPTQSSEPSAMPSDSPSASSAPSSMPSDSPSTSSAPSEQPTFCLKKSKTKSPGKGRGGMMMMTKSPVQTCFETAFPTPATKSAGKGKKSLRKKI